MNPDENNGREIKNIQAAKNAMLVKKLRSVLANLEIAWMLSSEPMAWTNAHGRIQWCNAAFEDLVQSERVELLGSSLLNVLPLHKDGRKLSMRDHPLYQALSADHNQVDRYEFRREEDVLELQVSYAPTHGKNETPTAILVIQIVAEKVDEKQIDQLKKQLLHARRQNVRLQRKVEEQQKILSDQKPTNDDVFAQGYAAKNALVANLTHEFRTPLSAILGYSDLLRQEAEMMGRTEWVKDLLEIRQASNQLLFMMNQLLDLAEIEETRTELNPTEFDVSKMVHELAGAVREEMEQQGNELQIRVEKDIGVLRTDEGKLRKVMLHLLKNSAKFTVRGQVIFEVRSALRHRVPHVRFVVRDNGIGIGEKKKERLFRAFTQGDESMTREYEGHGLGLYIANEFCKLMGGDIRLQSEQGAGTVVTVYIPRRIATRSLKNVSPPQPD